ncbi:MAG TPA: DinB family protein [Gemmatimonadaceae bacterium]|nr:DinB family protein [Gemmatimonadaceae bacterium]
MSIAGSVLPEFDQEMATTRTMLERVPENRAQWTPHVKSRTLGQLASHIGNLPRLGLIAMEADELDLNETGNGRSPEFDSTANLIRTFDENVRRARAAIESASDSDMMEPWTLRRSGRTVWTLPRAAVLRSFILSHMIHHRGQLSVYLRLNDVPLPSVYGPSADTKV